jgi:hypothetical protein
MKSIAKIHKNLSIGNTERLLWSKRESETGNLEAGSSQESEGAHLEREKRVQLWALRQALIKT